MERRGMVTQLQRFSLHDGPGIRTTVFMKGCNLHCPWCHNPETQSPQPQEMFFPELCVGCGHCEEGCTTGARVRVGTTYTARELARAVARDLPFYGAEGGVTFSGGEPLLQAGFLRETAENLAKECGGRKLHIAVDTALCVPWESFRELLPFTDLFLVDIKILSPETSACITGADPAVTEKNLKLLMEAEKEVWIRIPTLHGVNDTDREIGLAARLISQLDHVTDICTLPVFAHGSRKAKALGRTVEERWFVKDADDAAAAHAQKLEKLLGRAVHAAK